MPRSRQQDPARRAVGPGLRVAAVAVAGRLHRRHGALAPHVRHLRPVGQHHLRFRVEVAGGTGRQRERPPVGAGDHDARAVRAVRAVAQIGLVRGRVERAADRQRRAVPHAVARDARAARVHVVRAVVALRPHRAAGAGRRDGERIGRRPPLPPAAPPPTPTPLPPAEPLFCPGGGCGRIRFTDLAHASRHQEHCKEPGDASHVYWVPSAFRDQARDLETGVDDARRRLPIPANFARLSRPPARPQALTRAA